MTKLGNKLMARIGKRFKGVPAIIAPKQEERSSLAMRQPPSRQPMNPQEMRDIEARAGRRIRSVTQAFAFLREERELKMRAELFKDTESRPRRRRKWKQS